MLTLLYVLRLLGAVGTVAPTLAAIPLPQMQIAAGVVTVISEIATIILDRAPKIGAGVVPTEK